MRFDPETYGNHNVPPLTGREKKQIGALFAGLFFIGLGLGIEINQAFLLFSFWAGFAGFTLLREPTRKRKGKDV